MTGSVVASGSIRSVAIPPDAKVFLHAAVHSDDAAYRGTPCQDLAYCTGALVSSYEYHTASEAYNRMGTNVDRSNRIPGFSFV
jgi:hypothetical protein